jgi:hypothetical protein
MALQYHLLATTRQTIDYLRFPAQLLVGHALACPEKAWASGTRRDKLKARPPEEHSAVVTVAQIHMIHINATGSQRR